MVVICPLVRKLMIFLLLVQFVLSQQVHVSFHADDSNLVIQWLTFEESAVSIVRYGTVNESLSSMIYGNISASFQECSTMRYTNEVVLSGLEGGTLYYYQVSKYAQNYSFLFLCLF